MKKPRKYQRRVWLNTDPEMHGHLITKVECIERGPRDRRSRSLDVVYDVADCTRIVSLEFDVWNNADIEVIEERLRKARLLRDETVAFVEALEASYAWYQEGKED